MRIEVLNGMNNCGEVEALDRFKAPARLIRRFAFVLLFLTLFPLNMGEQRTTEGQMRLIRICATEAAIVRNSHSVSLVAERSKVVAHAATRWQTAVSFAIRTTELAKQPVSRASLFIYWRETTGIELT